MFLASPTMMQSFEKRVPVIFDHRVRPVGARILPMAPPSPNGRLLAFAYFNISSSLYTSLYSIEAYDLARRVCGSAGRDRQTRFRNMRRIIPQLKQFEVPFLLCLQSLLWILQHHYPTRSYSQAAFGSALAAQPPKGPHRPGCSRILFSYLEGWSLYTNCEYP